VCAILAACLLLAAPARAQFSAREGFTADGAYHWSFEVAPYLFLPAVDATIGLNHPPGNDISISQARPTVSKLVSTLNGAFVGFGLARYGDYSAELNVVYVSASQSKTTAPLLPGRSGATLRTTTSLVYVSPGIGYQLLPTSDTSKFTLDARVGFSYNEIDASAGFEESRFGGVSYNSSFAQPWIGARASYYPAPRWRIVLDAAATGLGVDGGVIGWNSRLGVSYLVTKWFDVSAGYAALQTQRRLSAGPRGENRDVDLLAYGPVVALGFRF
jgi:hypothetical protein